MSQGDSTLRLRLLMEVTGVTPGEIAKAAGVTKGAVSHWLRGNRRPPAAARAAIARVVTDRAIEAAFE